MYRITPHGGRVKKRSALPHSPDAEQGVIGGVLLRNDVLARLPELDADDMYDPRHKAIFGAIRALESQRRPVDVVTLEEELERSGLLEAVGGIAYLAEIAMRVPTVENVVEYAEIVTRKSVTRRVVLGLSEVVEAVRRDGVEGDDVIAAVDEVMGGIKRRSPVKGERLGDIARRVYVEVCDRVERGGGHQYTGVPVGLSAFDDFLGGAPFGVPTWVGGRPGAGKTTLLLCWAVAMASFLGDTGEVLFLSNEDQEDSFGYRHLGSSSGVPTTRIIRADVRDSATIRQLTAGANHAARSRVIFQRIHGMSGDQVARVIRRYHYNDRGRPVRAVIVDYIQRMAYPRGIRDAVQAISLNVQALGNVAGELKVALVGGAQLKREIEQRPWSQGGPVPQLVDFRGSGDIEQDGKVIAGLFHPWSYGKIEDDGTRTDPRTKERVDQSVLELHLLKNYNGQNGVVFPMLWEPSVHRIGDPPAPEVGRQPALWEHVPHPAEVGR